MIRDGFVKVGESVLGWESRKQPDWFKESFLEIQDDVDEATEEGKHVMLFFQLNACPYFTSSIRSIVS